jgi:hypothetical protein
VYLLCILAYALDAFELSDKTHHLGITHIQTENALTFLYSHHSASNGYSNGNSYGGAGTGGYGSGYGGGGYGGGDKMSNLGAGLQKQHWGM